jgi:hypothetical protein
MAFTSTKFPHELVREVFTGAKGKSSIAKLAEQTPIAFSGTDVMVFSMSGEVNLVAEGGRRVLTLDLTTPSRWFLSRSNTVRECLMSSFVVQKKSSSIPKSFL